MSGLMLFGLAHVALMQARPHPPAPTATGPDTRLIVRPQTVAVTGTWQGSPLHGTIYPAIPGQNTLRVMFGTTTPTFAPGQRVTLVITMLGMAMAPIRAELIAGARGITGTVRLPMFGAYRAALREAQARRDVGTMAITIPFPSR